MRFLHTADWHIGRTMRGRSRAAEFEAVLAEVVEIARDQQVEAMLVCGDIWDSAAPTADTDRLVFETLRQCIQHGIQVVLLAGNHDSPRKLEALGLLSELLGVHTQPAVKRPNAGGVITIEGREHVARIAAVPFIREGELIDAAQLMHVEEEHYGVYADAAGAIHQRMCGEFAPDTVNLLLGHVFINGATYATKDGSERQLHLGQQYGISPAALPATPQYIALGHIHRPQTIHEAPVPTLYAGSLLQLDFGEAGEQKRVVVLEAEPGRPVRQPVSIPLTKGRRLVELRGKLDAVLARAPDFPDAHIRVVLDVERPEPGLAQRVRDQVPGVVDVRLDYPEQAEPDAAGLAALPPDEQFARYYQAQHSAAPAPELLALFRELYDQTIEAERATLGSAGTTGA